MRLFVNADAKQTMEQTKEWILEDIARTNQAYRQFYARNPRIPMFEPKKGSYGMNSATYVAAAIVRGFAPPLSLLSPAVRFNPVVVDEFATHLAMYYETTTMPVLPVSYWQFPKHAADLSLQADALYYGSKNTISNIVEEIAQRYDQTFVTVYALRSLPGAKMIVFTFLSDRDAEILEQMMSNPDRMTKILKAHPVRKSSWNEQF